MVISQRINRQTYTSTDTRSLRYALLSHSRNHSPVQKERQPAMHYTVTAWPALTNWRPAPVAGIPTRWAGFLDVTQPHIKTLYPNTLQYDSSQVVFLCKVLKIVFSFVQSWRSFEQYFEITVGSTNGLSNHLHILSRLRTPFMVGTGWTLSSGSQILGTP